MPAKIYIILFLAGFFYPAVGNIADSLEYELTRAASDVAKIQLYDRIARELASGANADCDKALVYANYGLELAEQIDFPGEEAALNRTVGLIYYYQKNYDRALHYYQQALALCERTGDQEGMAQNCYNIGIVCRELSKPYYSLENLLKALSIWKQSENIDGMLSVYKDIIQLYQSFNEYTIAIGYTAEALAAARKAGNKSEEASLYDILARINTAMGNVWDAADHYEQSLALYGELGDSLQIARITQNIAVNLYANNPEELMKLLRKSAGIYEKHAPANNSLYTIYNNIGNIYDAENLKDSAAYYKELALEKALLSKNTFTIANACYTVGRFYLNCGQPDEAKKYFSEAYAVAESIGLASVQSNALAGLSSVDYLQENYKDAVENLRKYQDIRDSLLWEENKRNISQLTMQYEFEKAEREKDELLRTQLEKKEQDDKKQRLVILIVSLVLVFMATLLVFILRSNKINRQAKLKLEVQHQEILRINTALQQSNDELFRYKEKLEDMVRQQTAKLQQSEIQLRTLSDNLPGGCIYRKYMFPDGREVVSYISNTAEVWLGISVDAIMNDIGAFYGNILPEDLANKRRLEQESIRTMSSHSCEYRLLKDDGEAWLLENAMPHIGEDRNIVWDGIIVDITERKNFETELIKAKERAEESDMLKSSFLENMSHEIRTPMNGIAGFLTFIEKEDLPAEKRQAYIRIIRSNVRQLLQLIEDIIDISKIDSHLLALHPVAFDLNGMLDEVEIFFQDFILEKDKKLELVLDRSGFVSPGFIVSDPVRVRQILSNLIGNAIKFTHKGYVCFGYRLIEEATKLCFFVEDTGIGIPVEKQQYIFERFRQVHDSQVQVAYGGTGLGLAISKNLVEMLGGEIKVTSEENTGSVFYFTLPFVPQDIEGGEPSGIAEK
jgi:signal transduction histidine kinase/tetratricopeptide (TPR) repeat protein